MITAYFIDMAFLYPNRENRNAAFFDINNVFSLYSKIYRPFSRAIRKNVPVALSAACTAPFAHKRALPQWKSIKENSCEHN